MSLEAVCIDNMGAEEEIERIRIQERDRRRALAVYEDADMVEKDGDAAEANQPLMPELPRRQQTTIYKGLKPAKKRKNPSGKLSRSHHCNLC